MYISCNLKTSLKIHEKKKNHVKKITVSRQFSVRKIGNFGMERHGQDAVVSFMRVNYRRAGQR